jgi:type II secretory pathway component PulF
MLAYLDETKTTVHRGLEFMFIIKEIQLETTPSMSSIGEKKGNFVSMFFKDVLFSFRKSCANETNFLRTYFRAVVILGLITVVGALLLTIYLLILAPLVLLVPLLPLFKLLAWTLGESI